MFFKCLLNHDVFRQISQYVKDNKARLTSPRFIDCFTRALPFRIEYSCMREHMLQFASLVISRFNDSHLETTLRYITLPSVVSSYSCASSYLVSEGSLLIR